jgi:hypothetical protein
MRIPGKILARAAHGPVLLKVRHGRASRAMQQMRASVAADHATDPDG